MVLIASWGILSGIPLLLYIIYTLFTPFPNPLKRPFPRKKFRFRQKKFCQIKKCLYFCIIKVKKK